jgi:hypothetical protein
MAMTQATGPACAVVLGVLSYSGQRSHEMDVECRWFITLDFSLVNAGRRNVFAAVASFAARPM